MLKRFWIAVWHERRQQLPLLIAASAVFYFLYLWHLGQLAALSPSESRAINASSNLRAIWSNPINAPYKLLQFLSRQIFGNSPASWRLASVLLAGLFLISFYLLAARWFG